MLPDTFDKLPDEADVWIYAAGSPLDRDAAQGLERSLDELMAAWSYHGRRVLGARAVLDNRIVVVGAWVPDGTISGCGIDKSLHVLDNVAAEYDFEWVDGLSIVYRMRQNRIETCSRSDFRRLAAEGAVDTGTPVIDLSIRTLGKLRSNGLERPAGSSWHGQVFDLAPAADASPAASVESS